MIVTRILKPEFLNAATLTRMQRQVIAESMPGYTLLDLNQKLLDQLVQEGILG